MEDVRLIERHDLAMNLVGPAGPVRVVVREPFDLRKHLAAELAVVARLDGRQLLGMFGDQLGQTPK